MKTNAKRMIIGLVLAGLFCYAGPVWADTGVGTGSSPSASARLNFSIVIPEFIIFRVGNLSGENTIQFSPTAEQIDDSLAVDGTGGDVGGNGVTVRLVSNSESDVEVSATTDGAAGLSNGTSNIDYVNILTAESGSGLAPPQLTNDTTTSTTLSAGFNAVTTTWTYQYQRSGAIPDPGTYTGFVIYTASAP